MERQVMKSAAGVCVCACVFEEERKEEEHGPEMSLRIGRLLHSSETFMKKPFLTVSLSLACLYICSCSLFSLDRG